MAKEQYTQIYTPVTHTSPRGVVRRLVQVTNPDGRFCGWGDGAEKYDYAGTWEIDGAWAPAHAGELGRSVAGLRAAGVAVVVTAHGVERHVTSTL